MSGAAPGAGGVAPVSAEAAVALAAAYALGRVRGMGRGGGLGAEKSEAVAAAVLRRVMGVGGDRGGLRAEALRLGVPLVALHRSVARVRAELPGAVAMALRHAGAA